MALRARCFQNAHGNVRFGLDTAMNSPQLNYRLSR